jgi:hypothetical protein
MDEDTAKRLAVPGQGVGGRRVGLM